MNAIVPAGTYSLVPNSMDEAIRLAKAMASAKLVPKHLQDDVGSCLMVVEQAMRWGMSPFAVAQCTSSISGKLMWEGKLVAAAVENCGAIEGHFDYKFSGEGDARCITVSALRRGEAQPREITIFIKDVRTSNEWWKKQPDQMLVYSGTRNWARRWTPAAILGVYSPEEFDRSTGRITDDTGPVIEHEPEPAKPDVSLTEGFEQIRKITLRAWLDDFEARCAAANTEAEANAILKEERVLRLDDPDLKINPAALQRALRVRQEMVTRIFKPPQDEADGDDLPWPDDEAPAIKGEQYAAAG